MTASADAAYNGGSCCFIPQCAVTVSLSTTDGTTGDHGLYEVGEKHGECGLHKTLCESGTVTVSPTYNSVILVAFVGILAGIGNGLTGIATKAKKSTVKVSPILLHSLISDVFKSNKYTPVKFTLPFFKDWQQNATLNKVLYLVHVTKFSTRELPIVLLFNLWFAHSMHWFNSPALLAASTSPKTYSNSSQKSS